MTSGPRISLTVLIIMVTGLMTMVSMAIFAVIQFNTQDRSALSLSIEQGWHMLLFGLLIFLVLFFVLRRYVVHPINALYLNLYAVARGNLSVVEVESPISEIQEIAEGVNMILTKITSSDSGTDLVKLAQNAYDQIRLLINTEGEQLSSKHKTA